MLKVRGLNGHFAALTSWKVAISTWLLLAVAVARAADDGLPMFDIPAQPLEQAIERFSVASGWSVMYQGDLASGRTSHPVSGPMPPPVALEQLLQGSGLTAERAGAQRVVLRRALAGDGNVEVVDDTSLALERLGRYAGLQQRLRDGFCADPRLATLDYSASIAFHVAHDGRLHDIEFRAGSGDAQRDKHLLQVLHGLQLAPGASSLPQPVVLQIRPRMDGRECDKSNLPMNARSRR